MREASHNMVRGRGVVLGFDLGRPHSEMYPFRVREWRRRPPSSTEKAGGCGGLPHKILKI